MPARHHTFSVCNRYRAIGREELMRWAREEYGIKWNIPAPRYNIGPNQIVPIIVKDESGGTVATVARWNLIPAGKTGTEKAAPLMTNARSQGVLKTWSYRKPVQERRCLVPADGFYEWEHLHDGKIKIPWAFELLGRRPFAFAGLWERGDETKPPSFTILTTTPNDLVAMIHDRMPVMLSDDDSRRWITPGPMTAETLAPFVTPFPAERIQSHRVNSAVNNVRNESAEASAPANTDEVVTLKPAAPAQGELF